MPTFNYQKALDSGKSEQQILDYLSQQSPTFNIAKAQASNKSNIEIIKYLSINSKKPSSKSPEEEFKLPEKEIPDYSQNMSVAAGTRGIQPPVDPYEAGKFGLEKIATPAVEATGTALGSIYGTPLVGGALGYGISKQLMDIAKSKYAELGGEAPKETTIKKELVDTGIDVGSFIALGKAFDYALPAITGMSKAIHNKLTNQVSQRLYGSAVKAPLSKKWVKNLTGKEVSQRTVAIEEGLKSNVTPNDYGVSKIGQLKREVLDKIDDTTKILSENPDNVIKVKDIVSQGRKWGYKQAKKHRDPVGAKKEVDKMLKEFEAHGETLTPQEANAIKRDLYKKTPMDDPHEAVKNVTAKGMANNIKLTIEGLAPGIKSLNETYFARKSLEEILISAVAKEQNKNMISPMTKFLAVHKWPLAILNSTVGHPSVKSRVGILLAKANPKKYSKFIYPDKPVGYSPIKQVKGSANVYRYDPEFISSNPHIPQKIKTKLGVASEPINIKHRADIAQETAAAEHKKAIELAFQKAGYNQSKIGNPLTQPSTVMTKPTVPQTPKVTYRTAKIPADVKKKIDMAIEKDERARMFMLEQQFKKMERQKGLKGTPLTMPSNKMTKTTRPPTVEERLNKWNIQP